MTSKSCAFQSSHAAKSGASSSKSRKANDPLNSFTTDLNRELSAKEKEQLQRKADLMLAKDLFGKFLIHMQPFKSLVVVLLCCVNFFRHI